MPIEPSDIAVRLDVARPLVREAGAVALGYFKARDTLAIESKGHGQDVVSLADRATEKLIAERLAAAFPNDGLLGEEGGRRDAASGLTWVVDPIDGTACFVAGMSAWCVSVALIGEGRILAGLIYDPNADEMFVASAGRGAFLNDVPISVDPKRGLGDGLLGLGTSHRVPVDTVLAFAGALMRGGGMFIRNGSGALMLAYVACGRLVGYYEPHINAWDCLAGLCLISEAGGWTCDFLAGADLYEGGPIAAAAPAAKADLLRLIAEAGGVMPKGA